MSAGGRTLEDGIAHHQCGRWEQAEAVYQEVLARSPDDADALHLLGLVAFHKSKHERAIELVRRAVALRPRSAEFHSDLAMVLAGVGRIDESVRACRTAAELQPRSAKILSNLGNALQMAGRVDEAIDVYRRSLAIDARDVTTRNNLGEAYKRKALWDEAVAVFEGVLRDSPNLFAARLNLGGALQARGDLDDAIACFERAIQLKPDAPEAHVNLSGAYKDAGLLDRSIECFDRAIELSPDARTASGRLFLLHYHPQYDSRRIYDVHRKWYERYVKPSIQPRHVHVDNGVPDRRLRIGYVSPDFRDHPVAYNLLPLLGGHDHLRFEIFCYSNTLECDALTDRLKALADHWRDITGIDDQQTAELIAADRIDILVDLSLHTGNNRLLVFARKPAPVQVTFAGYPGTTGLEAIDHRFTDPYLDPPEACGTAALGCVPPKAESLPNASTSGRTQPRAAVPHKSQPGAAVPQNQIYAERSCRLPDSFWCYDPATREPQINALPALTNGFVTFGCLGNFCKINEEVLALWAAVLRNVPQSRLLLLSKRGRHRGRVIDFLAGLSVDPQRVEFVDQQSRGQYLRVYHRIDLGLDTVPYNGHTTSLDSFWMGVPVVTLVGKTIVGRAGLSQSCNLKLEELVARESVQFVQIATAFANDLPRLAELRSTLRGRMERSPLMDGKRFAANVEAAYRWMWERDPIISACALPSRADPTPGHSAGAGEAAP